MTQGYRTLLQYPSYITVMAGSVVSAAGSRLTTIALPLHIYHLTGEAAAIGIAFTMETIPWIAIGPFIGRIADRVDKRILLTVGEYLSAVCMLMLMLASSIYQIYFLYFVLGIINAGCASARGAFLPELIPREIFKVGLSFYQMLNLLVSIAMPAIGGILLGIIGPRQFFLFDAITFVVGGTFFAISRSSQTEKSAPLLSNTVWCDVMGTVRSIKGNRNLAWPLQFELLMTLSEAMLFPLIVVLVVNTLGFPNAYYSYLIMITSIGKLIGTYVTGLYLRDADNVRLIFIGSLVTCASYWFVTLNGSFVYLAAVFFVGALGDGVRTVIVHTMICLEAEKESRGLLLGIVNSAISILCVVGYALAGPVQGGLGTLPTFGIIAAVAVILLTMLYAYTVLLPKWFLNGVRQNIAATQESGAETNLSRVVSESAPRVNSKGGSTDES